MKRNKIIIIFTAVFFLGIVLVVFYKKNTSPNSLTVTEISPVVGDIQTVVSTVGVVEPQNRLEIKPPINGRVEQILVNEGDRINQGQILVWMSSTERAALLDSATAQGEESLKYWQDVYKATPLISPIDGEVIVRTIEPGQTVTAADPVLVLSNRLIVNAQFDETDIGRIHVNQQAVISLDAYPEEKIKGIVAHIAYESKLVNNVTVYDVDIVPERTPEFLRSGMSASVDVIERSRTGVLLLPLEAVIDEKGTAVVFVKGTKGNGLQRTFITTGISDGTNIEIVSGLAEDSLVVVKHKKYSPPKKSSASSPFLPQRAKDRKK